MSVVDKSRGTGKTNYPRNVKLEVGQTAAGYVTGFEESALHPGSFFIILQTETGEKISVSAKGNLRYRHSDGDITVGQYTVITRNPDRKNKKGKDVSDFFLGQDSEKTIDLGSELDAAGITNEPMLIRKPTSPVAAKAAALAKQVNAKS